MALKTFVKISGVNNLSDARYCAGMGVNQIGFILDPTNPDHISPEKYKEITEWISGVHFVGEFYDSSAKVIKELHQEYHSDYIQITQPEDIDYLKSIDTPIILRLSAGRIDDKETLEKLFEKHKDDVSYYLIEKENDTNNQELIGWIKYLSSEYPILLGFGITQDNVKEIIGHSAIKGIALKGGHEIKPGLKDFDELADILEKIEIDDLQE